MILNGAEIRYCLEISYYISGPILALAAIIGLKQIYLIKKDIFIRADRASKEKAIEYSSRYLSTYCKLSGVFSKDYESNNLKPYAGPIGNFSINDFKKEYLDNMVKRFHLSTWLPALNELQSIAAAFTSGVADEETGFSIVGKTYCSTVQMNYDIISGCRRDYGCQYYQNIVDLYKLWSPRISIKELEDHRNILDLDIDKLKCEYIKPIGID